MFLTEIHMQLADARYPHPLREDASGVIRVGDTRVTLQSVLSLFEQGATAEEIALRFDTLPLRDVYATLSFYMAHREEVAEYLNLQGQLSEEARQRAAARTPLAELRQRFAARLSA